MCIPNTDVGIFTEDLFSHCMPLTACQKLDKENLNAPKISPLGVCDLSSSRFYQQLNHSLQAPKLSLSNIATRFMTYMRITFLL